MTMPSASIGREMRRPEFLNEILIKRYARFPTPDAAGQPSAEALGIWLDTVVGVKQIGKWPENPRLEVTFVGGHTEVVCGRIHDFIGYFGRSYTECAAAECPNGKAAHHG